MVIARANPLGHLDQQLVPDIVTEHVIDEAGARSRLAPASRRKKTVGVADIEAMVAKMAHFLYFVISPAIISPTIAITAMVTMIIGS